VSLPDGRATVRWTPAHFIVLAAVVALAAAVRAVLLPTEGFRPDLDVYTRWVHEIAVSPIDRVYDGDINLPPVMVYIWAALATLQPAFQTAIDATDATIRVFLKAPASLADLGLALAAVWCLRGRPRWAIAGAAAIGLHPVLIDDSAWWGQIDSLYVLPAFIAFLLARAGRPIPAAVALGISLMTKPQALPFIVPFAAFALRRLGTRQLLLCAGVFVATVAVLWSPFLIANGPANYVGSVVRLQNGSFASLSIEAWNLWWLVGQTLPPRIVSDVTPLLGPLNAREIGLCLAALGESYVFMAVWRVPSARRLALGLACATLVSFSLLTTMHERYSFAALIFLVPLLPDRRILATWVGLSLAITANVLLAMPPWSPTMSPLLTLGWVSLLGSVLILEMTVICLWLLTHDGPLAVTSPELAPPGPLSRTRPYTTDGS
jgi:dolichyl-phosphate-mannose-protein mannosyltransferase